MNEDLVGPPLVGVTQVEVDGRICVYSPRSGQVLMLNETASDVWRLSDGTLTRRELISTLARAYGQSDDDVADDIAATVERFHEAVLLQPSAG